MSCGGPILTPGSDNFVITPVSPHNLNLRPLVVSDNENISLKAESREGQFLLTMDSQSFTVDNNKPVRLKKAEFTLSLIELEDQNFSKPFEINYFGEKTLEISFFNL